MEVNHIYHGENISILQDFPDNCIDALVCDPPAGISFMNMEFDSDRGGRLLWVAGMAEMMREFLRVMKPGAHGFVWALPRTSHWTMCALEDAGFEIRDVVHHIFAQGMPKGKNIGKAVDKQKGAERQVLGIRDGRGSYDGHSRTSKNPSNNDGYGTINHVRDVIMTAPVSPEAIQWEGWNTTLKPAVEYWILVRKPLAEKTIVQQVLKTGTGALNIDACRVDAQGEYLGRPVGQPINAYGWSMKENPSLGQITSEPDKRWPATVLLTHAKECAATTCATHCPVAVLDAQSGVLKSGEIRPEHKSTYDTGVYGNGRSGNSKPREASEGGASRYFTNFPYEKVPVFYFIPKASPSDRTMRQMVPNPHPTAKSTLLMSWLNTLITPPGGIILDPFAGSGSTLVAAKRDGFQYIGIEQREDYVEIAKHRLTVV